MFSISSRRSKSRHSCLASTGGGWRDGRVCRSSCIPSPPLGMIKGRGGVQRICPGGERAGKDTNRGRGGWNSHKGTGGRSPVMDPSNDDAAVYISTVTHFRWFLTVLEYSPVDRNFRRLPQHALCTKKISKIFKPFFVFKVLIPIMNFDAKKCFWDLKN
jgi:hypothetical protein